MIAQLQGQGQQFYKLSEIAKIIPGRRLNISTVWRWVNKGVRGERLVTTRIGGTNFISQAELERFLSAINDKPVSICNKSRVKQLAKVSAELDVELA